MRFRGAKQISHARSFSLTCSKDNSILSKLKTLVRHNKRRFNNYLLNYELWTITMNPLLQIKCNNAVKNLHLKHNLNPNSQASPAGCQLKNMSSCGPEGNPFRKKAIADKWLNYLYTNKTWQNHSKDFKRNFESSYNVIKTCSRVKAVDTLEKNKLFIVSEIKALIGWCKTGLSGLFPIMHHS